MLIKRLVMLPFLLVLLSPYTSVQAMDPLEIEDPDIPRPRPTRVAEVLAAKDCADPNQYRPEDSEYSNGFNDEGSASFWNGLDIPAAFGFYGNGGHKAEVWMCTTGRCTGGWLPVVSDFYWSGNSLLGHGAAVTVHSGHRKVPHLYKTCEGKAKNFLTAMSDARTIEGNFPANATHGGIMVPESSGRADLFADGNIGGPYAYTWKYHGIGYTAYEETIKDNVCVGNAGRLCDHVRFRLKVYGVGSDDDLLS